MWGGGGGMQRNVHQRKIIASECLKLLSCNFIYVDHRQCD